MQKKERNTKERKKQTNKETNKEIADWWKKERKKRQSIKELKIKTIKQK